MGPRKFSGLHPRFTTCALETSRATYRRTKTSPDFVSTRRSICLCLSISTYSAINVRLTERYPMQ